jgi:hypothetical protein
MIPNRYLNGMSVRVFSYARNTARTVANVEDPTTKIAVLAMTSYSAGSV